MASIVEKETGLAGERNKIAGVFNRRLAKGMLLQTDPSVIYGMGDAYAGNIRKEDLLRDTAYNTYVHTGLPPTPISMQLTVQLPPIQFLPPLASAFWITGILTGSKMMTASFSMRSVEAASIQ